MKRRNRLWLFLVLVVSTFHIKAQNDSLNVLTLESFVAIVREYHPVASQANLLPAEAKANLLIARGGWDPTIQSDYDSKTLDGNNYYSYFESSVKIPVWYGIQVKSGYDFAYGNNISAENKIPPGGLGYVGVSVSLLKGMLMDKQRADLKAARIFTEANEQQRIAMLNDLLRDALTTYYEWSLNYIELQTMREALRVAEIRLEASREAVKFGDRAAIDTVEAATQVFSRLYETNDARLRFINKGLELSNYLWTAEGLPYGFDTSIVPEPLVTGALGIDLSKNIDSYINTLAETNPVLAGYRLKLQQLDVERRLKIENLKPVLNANYNLLSKQFGFTSSAGNIFVNNYKFGVNLSFPLTFMKGRGEMKMIQLKIRETQLAQQLKMQETTTKLKSYYNEILALYEQTLLYERNVDALRQLWLGENTRFTGGESTLFVVNSRENKYIESQIKLAELRAKYYKSEAMFKWTVGNLSR